MKTRALITQEDQTFEIMEANLPECKSDEILIRTSFSGVSIGTEFALIRGKLSWEPFPLCTGYMATGIVEYAGKDVANFQVGDKVFVRGNASMALPDGTKIGCVEGGHAAHIIRKPNDPEGCGIVPDGADMAAASMYVMPAVALNGLAQAQPEATEKVIIYGVGLIGIGVCSLAALRGCEVIAIDINSRALELARSMGADHTIDASRENWREQLSAIAPRGGDCVVEATGIAGLVDTAISLCRPKGKFVWQGNYGEKPVSYDFLAAHGRQIKSFYPCHDGQLEFRMKIVKLIASGALPWERVITHKVPCADAPSLFERINKNDKEIVGAVIDWR